MNQKATVKIRMLNGLEMSLERHVPEQARLQRCSTAGRNAVGLVSRTLNT